MRFEWGVVAVVLVALVGCYTGMHLDGVNKAAPTPVTTLSIESEWLDTSIVQLSLVVDTVEDVRWSQLTVEYDTAAAEFLTWFHGAIEEPFVDPESIWRLTTHDRQVLAGGSGDYTGRVVAIVYWFRVTRPTTFVWNETPSGGNALCHLIVDDPNRVLGPDQLQFESANVPLQRPTGHSERHEVAP